MKISQNQLLSFRDDITNILSPTRLEGYGGDKNKHFVNLKLSKQTTIRLALLEIYLRNMLDFCLSKTIGKEWIKTQRSLALIKAKGNTPLQERSTHQILSSLMFGELVGLIEEYKVKAYMLDLRKLDFKKYHYRNNDFFRIKGKKTNLSNVSKVDIALNLIQVIRNRAFHWENLLKTRIIKGETYPRIVTIYPKNEERSNQTIIGIMPDKILDFLNDLIECIGNVEIKSYVD